MLYSYKKKYPKELPNRIRLPNGLTKTDKTTFTDEEIADAGYILVSDPPALDEGDSLHWDGDKWVVKSLTPEEKLSYQWSKIRELRDGTIASVLWRVERYHSEVRLGLEPTDDIVKLDKYIQALRDITKQPDPSNIEWPELPTKANSDAVEE